MKENLKIETSKLLLVEGNDEYWFFIQLLQFLGFNRNVPYDLQVMDIAGGTKFKNSLSLLVKFPDFDKLKTVGFIRDAEKNNALSAYQSISSMIEKSLPAFPLPEIGSVKTENGFSTGIFIMPNNKNAGMLEDLCMESLASEPLYKDVEDYVSKAASFMSETNQKKYNTHKAKVQTYLAGQTEIVSSIANAAKKNMWNFSNPVFADAVNFVKKLIKT